jgi:hypothetical protein
MKIATCAALAVLVAGCTPTIEYARRSLNEPRFPLEHKDPVVTVSSTAQAPKTPDAAPDGALGKSEVRLDFRNPDAATVAALKKALEPAPEQAKFDGDRSVLKRTIVATVSRGEYRPADRFVNFRLRIEPANFAFTGYTGTATDYTSIDIANFKLAKTNSAGLEVSGDTPIAKKITASADRVLTETGAVKARIENATTNIDDRTLDIYREAERGIDLAGNTLVNVGVTAKPEEADTVIQHAYVVTAIKISNDDGKPLPADKASLKTTGLTFLQPRDLTAKVTFSYVLRRVIAKSNEYTEHNQTVRYEAGECVTDTVVIVPARDLDVPRWHIMTVEADLPRYTVNIDSDIGKQPLTFVDYADALRLANWMTQQKATRIGNSSLSLSDKQHLDKSSYPALMVRKASDSFRLASPARPVCGPTATYESPPDVPMQLDQPRG